MSMRYVTGGNDPMRDMSPRCADHGADEIRLGLLLEQTYAARETRLTPPDDALVRLNAALDAIGTSPRQHSDYRRLIGVCALATLLLLLLTPIARAEFAGSARNATRSAIIPINGTSGAGADPAANGSAALAPAAAVASEGRTATDHAPTADVTAPLAAVSETPLRDLLARAGIQPPSPDDRSSGVGQPHQP
jgi:hypothetical protein